MVLVFLGPLQFEATRFETRTMPTPNLKGKEVIYWIIVETKDNKLLNELQRFLNSSLTQPIELRVPSAFIAARTELESYKPIAGAIEEETQQKQTGAAVSETEGTAKKDTPYHVEIVLRRTLPEQSTRHPQSPYG